MTSLDLQSGSIDTICVISLLKYLDYRQPALREMRRVPGSGGRPIVSVPYQCSLWRLGERLRTHLAVATLFRPKRRPSSSIAFPRWADTLARRRNSASISNGSSSITFPCYLVHLIYFGHDSRRRPRAWPPACAIRRCGSVGTGFVAVSTLNFSSSVRGA